MYVDHLANITGVEVNIPDKALNVLKQVAVGPEQGWQGWVMRVFTIGGEGFSPRHSHPWPHINYIISGQGTLFLDGQNYEVRPGSVAYVPDNLEHQFTNTGSGDFTFICIVPEDGDK